MQYIPEFKQKTNLQNSTSFFTASEIRYSKTKKDALQTLCGIFTVKEAFLKAISLYITDMKACFNDIEIAHESNGKPKCVFHNGLKTFMLNNLVDMDVSISHSFNVVVANVSIIINPIIQ